MVKLACKTGVFARLELGSRQRLETLKVAARELPGSYDGLLSQSEHLLVAGILHASVNGGATLLVAA